MNAFTVFLGFRFHLISFFSSFTQEIFGDNSQLQNLEGVLTAVLVFFASRFSISYFCFKQTSFLGHVVREGVRVLQRYLVQKDQIPLKPLGSRVQNICNVGAAC